MANNAGHFEALDACHLDIAQHIQALGTLVQHIEDHGIDDHARREAHSIEAFFSSTSRQHHAQEERDVFTALMRDHIALEEHLIYPQAKALWAQALSQSRKH